MRYRSREMRDKAASSQCCQHIAADPITRVDELELAVPRVRKIAHIIDDARTTILMPSPY